MMSKGFKSGTHDVGPCRPRSEDERWEQAELSYSAGEKHSTACLVKRYGRVRVKMRGVLGVAKATQDVTAASKCPTSVH